ncbi:MAG TPA: TonB-dependent receptor [Gemmatimonadaceae bacterium]|nr:TonB-dependent receptor [Gemmatimonadaceae bacterium]
MRHTCSGSSAVKLASSLLLLALCLPGRRAAAQRAGTGDSVPGFTPLSATTRDARLDAPLRFTFNGTLRELIVRIAARSGLSVTFDDSLPGLGARSSFRFDGASARTAILRALQGSPLRALVSPAGQIVLVRRAARAAPPTDLRGQVRDATVKTPVLGARVDLVGTRFSAYSRENGEFSVGRVPPGRYDVRVLRLGFEPLAATIRYPEDLVDGLLTLELRHASVALSEIIVTPGYFGLLQPSLAAPNALSRERLETIPQIGEDIYRAVSRLPGVSADDFSAKFSVRGGSGDELYVSLDGLELVEPFHLKDLGGSFSIVDIQSLGTASLTTGGFSAEYGDRLTGVFTLATADPRTDRTRTSLGISVMNARATSQGGFGGGKGGWLVSARPGYLDVALKLTDVRDSIRPRYYDLFAKAQYDIGRDGRVALHFLRANDTFRYLLDDEPSISSRYGSDYAWLTWDDRFGARARMRSVVSVGSLEWRRDGGYVDDGIRSAVLDRRSMRRLGVRQDWTLDVSESFLLKWGVDVKHESAAYDYFSAIRPRDPRRDSTAIDTTTAAADPRTDRLGLYLAPRMRLHRTLTAELGARFDRNSHLDESMIDPRLNLTWEPRAGTTVRGAWGRYSQTQPLFALQAQDGESEFAPAEHAEQRILGFEQTFASGLVARVEAYDRHTRNARPTYLNAGGDLMVFPELAWDRVRVDRTEGRDRGIELQASRANVGRSDWSISYSLAKSTDLVGGRTIARSLDERHAVHADWSIRPKSNAWRLSAGAVWHSGWPYTPTVLVVDTLENTDARFSLRSTSTVGDLNSERLRSYKRFDVRWTRYFDTPRGRVSVFGEVYNLFDNQNARGMWKQLRVRGRGVLVETGEITQWPRLPLAGLSWEF